MAKGAQEYEREIIDSLPEKTGKTLEEWMHVIRESGLQKNKEILNWLKETFQFNHAQANCLAGIFLNDGKPVYDYKVLFEKLFADKPDVLAIYQALEKLIQANMPDVVLVPTKTYVSIEGKKVFGCATPTKQTIRLGLDLGDLPFDDRVEKAKGLGAMPNISHMIEVKAIGEVDQAVLGYLQQAYSRLH